MTALSRTHSGFARTIDALVGESPFEVKRRLMTAMEVYRNEDAVSRDHAVGALADGRAAYWTTATYHNQCGCNLVDAVNKGSTVQVAISKHYAIDAREGLDTLVPLNSHAVYALSNAYAEIGTWREYEELEVRRVRDTRRRR